MRLQKERNVSYLFITHDIATVEAIPDEIVVMLDGRVIEQGLKDKVLSPLSRNTLNACSNLFRKWTQIGSTAGSMN